MTGGEGYWWNQQRGSRESWSWAWHTVSTKEMTCQCPWEGTVVGWECAVHVVREALNCGHQCLALKGRATLDSSMGH